MTRYPLETQQSLADAIQQSEASPVECLGMTFASDADRREYFAEKLKEKLSDPEFRKVEGFPIGSDQNILRLSDPPHFTACPNPFLQTFVEHFQTEDNAATYRATPLTIDVTEGKNDPIYNAHSYHTKVPHKAIMRYILHYSRPGDIVFDGFAGTGMTGVAAQLCSVADPQVRKAIEAESPDVRFGSRKAVLCDLSPEATFIAHSLNSPYSQESFARAVRDVTNRFEAAVSSLYTTHVDVGRQHDATAEIVYTIWSDRVACPECATIFTYSDAAVNRKWTEEFDSFRCPNCDVDLSTRKLKRVLESKRDSILGSVINISQQVPVLMSCSVGTRRYRKVPDQKDLQNAVAGNHANSGRSPVIELDRLERYFKDSLHLRSYTHVHHLYTERTWYALSTLKTIIDETDCDLRTRQQLLAVFTSVLPRLDRLNRYMPDHQRHVGPLVGTLYVSWLTVEISVLQYWKDKSKAFLALRPLPGNVIITTGSSTSLKNIPDNSIDYIFTDPPFGHNLQYGELNQRAEAWLGVLTDKGPEAVVSDAQKKDLFAYESLMTKAFSEARRILKPGRWMTVEFHNSRNSVWNSIQQAISAAGFVVADVRTLDKKKGTVNQLFYTAGAVKQDLVISAYKPDRELEQKFELDKGTEEGVWDFVRNHLQQLPILASKDGHVEVVAERQPYLLFDRMVGFHVQHAVSVPYSAGEFYAGLGQRFIERDGVYLLSDQAAEYDRRRLKATEVRQLEIFITNEPTAIQWLRQQLLAKPQTFQELHPKFLQEISGWDKHERPLELRELLDENFLVYDGNGDVPEQIHGYLSSNIHELRRLSKQSPLLRQRAKDRYYVPDPNKEADVQKARQKALLREFNEYVTSKRKTLPVFRLDAVREGFRKSWQQNDYVTIIAVAERLPEDVVQEDPMLLMWYTNSLTRSGRQA